MVEAYSARFECMSAAQDVDGAGVPANASWGLVKLVGLRLSLALPGILAAALPGFGCGPLLGCLTLWCFRDVLFKAPLREPFHPPPSPLLPLNGQLHD